MDKRLDERAAVHPESKCQAGIVSRSIDKHSEDPKGEARRRVLSWRLHNIYSVSE